MITWIKRSLLTVTMLALIATNILTLTHTAFNTALSGLMGTYLGVRTVASAMQSKLASKNTTIKKQKSTIKKQKATTLNRKAATRRFGTRLANRTKRVVGKSIAAIPAESIPFLGVAVLIADTGYEVYAACETMRDMDELYSELGMADETPDDAIHSACNPHLPDAGEVWDGVVARSADWLDQVREAM